MIASLQHRWVSSPIGRLRIVADAHAIVAVELPNHADASDHVARERPDHPLLREAAAQLEAYFAGALRRFELPLAGAGTDFQREVWAALTRIPYGETRSYAELAALVGRPRAVRAVGAANGRNPLAIVVPCHRVIGADGSLTGYAGGLAAKRWLLAHEARQRELFA